LRINSPVAWRFVPVALFTDAPSHVRVAWQTEVVFRRGRPSPPSTMAQNGVNYNRKLTSWLSENSWKRREWMDRWWTNPAGSWKSLIHGDPSLSPHPLSLSLSSSSYLLLDIKNSLHRLIQANDISRSRNVNGLQRIFMRDDLNFNGGLNLNFNGIKFLFLVTLAVPTFLQLSR